VQKGLFFWSPLLLGAVAGFVVGDRKKLPFLAGTVVVLTLNTYLIASWWDWQFGASYGHRGFVDVLPLLASARASSSGVRPVSRDEPPSQSWRLRRLPCRSFRCSSWNGVLPMST
jgi:hypothetical protein